MFGVGPWGHPGMMMGPCGMMGRENGRGELVSNLICSMAKAGDSKRQIENNIKVALAYADKLEEAAREHRRKEAFREELRHAAGEVSNAEVNLARAREDLARRQKEHEKMLKAAEKNREKADSKTAGSLNESLFCLERAQQEVPHYEKSVEERRKTLKLLKEKAVKAGLSFLLAEKG